MLKKEEVAISGRRCLVLCLLVGGSLFGCVGWLFDACRSIMGSPLSLGNVDISSRLK